MRFFGRVCGKCYMEKSRWQLASTWFLVAGGLVIVAGVVLSAVLTRS